MATSVSERPRPRRVLANFKGYHMVVGMALMSLAFYAFQGKSLVLALVCVLAFVLFWSDGIPMLRHIVADRRQARRLARGFNPDVVVKPRDDSRAIRPIKGKSRTDVVIEVTARASYAAYRETRKGLHATRTGSVQAARLGANWSREIGAPAVKAGAFSVAQWVQNSALPRAEHMLNSLNRRNRPSHRSLVFGGSAALLVLSWLTYRTLHGNMVEGAWAIGGGTLGVFLLMMVAFVFTRNSTTMEGGLVMNEADNTTHDHGEGVPTSAPPYQRPGDIEDTQEFALVFSPGTGTADLDDVQRAARQQMWQGVARTAVATGVAPADVARVVGSMASPAPIDMDTMADDLVEDDRPSANITASSSPTWQMVTGDEDEMGAPIGSGSDAAHRAAAASDEDDDYAPHKMQEEEENGDQVVFRLHWLMPATPIAGLLLGALLFWMYVASDDLLAATLYGLALLVLVIIPFWTWTISFLEASQEQRAQIKSVREAQRQGAKVSVTRHVILARFASRKLLKITVGSLLGIGVLWGILAFAEAKDVIEWAWLKSIASFSWSLLVSLVSTVFASAENFVLSVFVAGAGRALYVIFIWLANPVKLEDGWIKHTRGLVFRKKRKLLASKITDYSFEPVARFFPWLGTCTLNNPEQEQSLQYIENFPRDKEKMLEQYITQHND